ncbi:hypothetical protein F4680DRAFT_468050 [Xylaria scruposa]|nr:hypothetical protein F4680DRAFT_468050 [Xylaria scruposa]
MKKRRIRFTDQAFSIQLRLSGNLHANKEDVELRPTVWIICASEFCKELVLDALSQPQLEWVEQEPKEVVDGLKFLGRGEQVENLDLSGGICFTDSYRLHLHTEKAGQDNSACGLITYEDDSSSDFSDSEPEIEANLERPRISSVSSVAGWNVVPEVIILDFVRMASPGPSQSWRLSTEVNAHDFVLFKIRNNDFTTLRNSYEYRSVKHLVTSEAAVTPPGLEVTILLGPNRLARGRILSGISRIRMAGVEFSTMRILLNEALAPGTSGSRVVSGSDLHGIITTSYDQDPIAQMITTRQLFIDIVSALPRVKSINLPSFTSTVKERPKSTKAEPSVSNDTTMKSLKSSSVSETHEVATDLTHLLSNSDSDVQPHINFNPDVVQPISEQALAALVEETRSQVRLCYARGARFTPSHALGRTESARRRKSKRNGHRGLTRSGSERGALKAPCI